MGCRSGQAGGGHISGMMFWKQAYALIFALHYAKGSWAKRVLQDSQTVADPGFANGGGARSSAKGARIEAPSGRAPQARVSRC